MISFNVNSHFVPYFLITERLYFKETDLIGLKGGECCIA